jgi:hypothetical protein
LRFPSSCSWPSSRCTWLSCCSALSESIAVSVYAQNCALRASCVSGRGGG